MAEASKAPPEIIRPNLWLRVGSPTARCPWMLLSFEFLQGWRLHNLFRQTVTVLSFCQNFEEFFLMFKQNFLHFSLCLQPLVLSLATTEQSGSVFFTPLTHVDTQILRFSRLNDPRSRLSQVWAQAAQYSLTQKCPNKATPVPASSFPWKPYRSLTLPGAPGFVSPSIPNPKSITCTEPTCMCQSPTTLGPMKWEQKSFSSIPECLMWYHAHIGSTYTECRMTQGRLAQPLCEDDMHIHETLHCFLLRG